MSRTSSLPGSALAVSGLVLLLACTSNPTPDNYFTAPQPPTVSGGVVLLTPPDARWAASAPVGRVLTTENGMTVYVSDLDSSGRSNCYDQCAKLWMPVYGPAGAVAGSGLMLIQRADGRTQWATANGMPLYTYVNDHAPGDAHGNNVDGRWHVVAN